VTGDFRWDDRRVRQALGLPPDPAREGLSFRRISTDTRTLEAGDLFVALRGPNHDGHDHLGEAAARGAAGAVVSAVPEGAPSMALYRVEDTLAALGALGRYRRRALGGASVVGITGSSGKTTAKELLKGALGSSLRVHATEGNLNNRVGLPLTLLAAPDDCQVVVAEMGTNEPGEIRILTALSEPDVGVITTVAEAHLEKLGSLEGVMEEKLDLLRGLPAGGTAVVGDEPPGLAERARELGHPVRVSGLSAGADAAWRGVLLDADEAGRWHVRIPSGSFRCGLPGAHGVRNALLALAVADLLGVPSPEALRGVASVGPTSLRGEIRRIGPLAFLIDCYNANPQSTRAALALLTDLPARGGHVAVLGSMLELGSRSADLHRELLSEALRLPLRAVVAVGEFARAAADLPPAEPGRPELLAAPSPDEAYEALRPRLRGGETLLLKGSRGVRLERLLPRFEADFGDAGGAD
jgi:UDP-N-acetylmuramoyl-tripeptide--D-alanyl-D-alanine ligase